MLGKTCWHRPLKCRPEGLFLILSTRSTKSLMLSGSNVSSWSAKSSLMYSLVVCSVLITFASCWRSDKKFVITYSLSSHQTQRGRISSVGRARDSGGPWFDPRCSRPLPTGWVGVSIMWPAETEVMCSPLCLAYGSTYNFQTSVLGPVRNIA